MTQLTHAETDVIYKSLLYYLKQLKAHKPVNMPDKIHTNSMILDTMIARDKFKKLKAEPKSKQIEIISTFPKDCGPFKLDQANDKWT